MKMYDKAGVVLRIEAVINNPEEVSVRKRVTRKGHKTSEWVQMRKGVRQRLLDTPHLRALRDDPRRAGAKVSRILHRFHAHGLIARVPHSRRWRLTEVGRRVLATSIHLREVSYQQLLATAS